MLQVAGYHIQVSRNIITFNFKRLAILLTTIIAPVIVQRTLHRGIAMDMDLQTMLEKQCKKEQHREGVTIFIEVLIMY